MELAGRGRRLLAAIVDGLAGAALGALAGVAIPLAKGSPALLGLAVGLLLLGAVGLMGVQLRLLSTRGQTIGKAAVGVRIAKAADGTNGGFVTNVVLRMLVGQVLPALVPIAGLVYALADLLFIFREDRRCLHDLIAGTRVVTAAIAPAPSPAA